jgi:putative alpha-1,2-mannosidase
MGFYPVCPGSNEYIIGSPLFKSAKLKLENGKQTIIQSENNNPENRYIESLKLNGATYSKNYLRHDDLIGGAKLNFSMSPAPQKNRGTQEKDFPYSFSKESK